MANGGNIRFGIDFDVKEAGLNNLKKSLTDIQKMKIGDIDTKDIKKAEKELESVKDTAKKVQQAIEQSFNVKTGATNISKLKQELQNIGMDKISKDFSNAGSTGAIAFRNMANAIGQVNIKAKESNKFLDELAVTFSNTIKWNIASGAMNSITRSVQQATGYIKSLDTSLNNIQIVSGQSAEQMDQFAIKANNAAKALGSTTTAYTDAALIFYQQGLDADTVEARTNATIKMANVTGDSAEEVSSYMTAIWNNFDDGSQSLEHYADVITALGASTASSSAEISEGLEKFASIGETVGLSYDYATSALATVVANTRQSADTVGTAFKTIFSRLQGLKLGESLEDGTDLNKYSQALDAIGVNIKDQNGELKQMDTILDETAAKWGTLTQDQKMAMAQTVAGTRQYTQLISLLDNWGDMEKNLETAANAEGALQEQQDIYMESLEAHLKTAKASVEDLYDSLLDSDSFKTVTDLFTGLVNQVSNFIDAIGGGGTVIAALGAIVTRVFSGQISKGISATITKVGEFKKSFLEMIGKKNSSDDIMDDVKNTNENSDMSQADKDRNKKQMNANSSISAALDRGVIDKETADEQYETVSKYTNQANKISEMEGQKQAADKLISKIKELNGTKVEDIIKDDNLLGLSALNDTIVQVNSSVKTMNKSFDDIEGSAASLSKIDKDNNVSQVCNEIIKIEEALDGLDNEAASITSLLPDGSEKEIKRIQSELRDLSKDIKDTYNNDDEIDTEKLNTLLSKVKEYKDLVEQAGNNSNLLENTVSEDFLNNLEEGRQELDELGRSVDDINNENNKLVFLDDIGNMIGSIGTLVSGLSMVGNAFSILGDESKTAGEKISGIFTTLVTGLPMILSSFGAIKKGVMSIAVAFGIFKAEEKASMAGLIGNLIGVKIASDATFKELLIKMGALIAEEAASGAGFLAMGASGAKAFAELIIGALGLDAKLAPLLTAVIAIVAAFAGFAAIAGIIYGIVKAIDNFVNGAEKAAKAAKEAAEEQKKAYEETKAAYEELKSSVEDYQGMKDALSQMTKGTDEWKEAVIELNDQVLSLLDKYPELASYINDTDGVLSISDEGLDKVLNEQKNRVQDQAALKYQMQANVNETEAKAIKSRGVKDTIKTLGSEAATYSIEGPLFGAIDLFGDILSGRTDELFDKLEDKALERQKEIDANEKAAEQNRKQATKTYLENSEGNGAYKSSDYQDAIIEAVNKSQKDVKTGEYKGGLFGKNDKTIQKEYAELMGYDTTNIKNNKGTGTYYDKSGKEIGEISDETARTVLAQQKKMSESAENLDAFASSVESLANSAKELSNENEEVSKALASLAGGKEAADLSGLTKDQIKDFSETDVSSLSNEDIKNLGFKNRDELEQAIQQSAEEANRIFNESLDALSEDLRSHVEGMLSGNDFKDITLGGQQAIIEAYNQLSKQYGQAGVDALDNLLKEAGDKADTVSNIMKDIDWSSTDAEKQFEDALKEAKIELDPNTVQDIVQKMETINGAFDSVDTSKLQNQISGLKDALDMEIGDTISDKDYLEKFGDEFNDFFITLDDGTHMLIKSAEEFQDAVKNKIRYESDINYSQAKENLRNDINLKQDANNVLGVQANDSDHDIDKKVSKITGTNAVTKDEEKFDQNVFQKQRDFIETMGTASGEDIAKWDKALKDYNDSVIKFGENTIGSAEAYQKFKEATQGMGDAASEAKEKYSGLDDEIEKSRQEQLLAQEQYAATRESINELNGALADGSINQEQFEKNLDRVTQLEAEMNDLDFDDIVDQGAALAKQYHLTAAQGRQLSIENQRMNKGIATLNKNFKTWKKTLQTTDKTSIDNVNAMQDMNAAVVDLVGASKDLKLPSEFFDNADNMELIGKAAKGDTDAINELGVAVAYAQVEMMEFNNAKPEGMSDMEWGTSEAYALGQAFESSKETVLNGIQAMQEGLDGLSIGDNVYDKLGGADWVDALNTMALDTEMSVEQMNSMLNSMGVQADVTTQTKTVQTNVPQYVTEETVEQTSAGDVGEDGVSTKPATYKKTSHTYQEGTVPVKETIEVAAIGTGKNPPKITYTGNGGAAPSSTANGKKGGGGGGGKKSGKKNNAKVNKRADKEEVSEKDSARYEDEFNYYFREEKILNKVTDALEKLQDAQNGLHGAELINNLKEQNEQLEDQKKALDGVIEKTKKLSAEYQHKKDDKKTGIQYNDYVKAYNRNNDWDYYQKLMKNKKKLSDSDKDKLKEYQEKYGKKGSNKYKKYAKKAKKDKQLEYAYEAQKAGTYAKAMTTVKKLKPKKKLSKKEEKRLKAAKEVLKDNAAETAFYEASSGEKLSKKEKKAFKTINKYSGKKKLNKKEKSTLTKAAKKLGGKVTKVKGKYKVVGGKTVKGIAKFKKSDAFKAEKNAKNYDKYTELKKKKPKDLTKKDKKALKNLKKKFDTKQKKGLKGKTAKAKEKARVTKARKNVANAKAFKQAVKRTTTSEKNDLSDFGIKFDKDGKMTTDSYEKVTKREYNKMEAAKEDLKSGKITEEQYEKIEKRYNTLKELIEKQKEAEDKINETLKERNKILDQQIENNRAALQEKIDINVNFNNAKKEWNNLKADFEKNGLNSSTPKSLEWNKNNNFISQQSNISADAAASDFDSDKANFNVYKDSAQEALGEFDYYSNGGEKTSNMIYKSKSDALDALKEYQTELNASINSMMDDYNNANQALLDGISEYKEQLSKIDDGYERINIKLERMSKLNALINGNGAKGRNNNIEIAKVKQGNAKNQLESAVAESSKMKSLYDKAIQDGNKDAAEQYYAAWQEAEGKVSSSIEAVAEAADELFNQKLNKSIETFYSTLSDNKFTSLGDMKEDWEDSTKNVEEYLDSVTRVYKQQTLMSKVQKSIDSTSNSGHREELEAFYKKENEALKNKQKLTQYDIDLAEKKYNILLKQQALEDAMNNKDSMKMARGADGNWSYQYVADDSKVKEAQQAVSDGWYELYELTNNAYKDNINQIMSLTEEMESKIREVYADETLSIEQKNEKAKIIEEKYSNWIISLSQQNAQIQNDLNFATVGNLTQAVMINADNLNSLTEKEKEAVQTGIEAFKGGIMEYETEFESTTSKLKEVGKEAMESTRTDINTGIQQMIDKIAGPDGEATFKGAINAMDESIKTAMTDYANSINDAYGKTNTTLKNMSSDLTTLTGDSDKLKAKTTEICTAMGNDYDKLGGKLKTLREQLSGTYNDAEALNNRILQLSQNEINETSNAPSHSSMPLVQGDNKLEVGDNVVVKAGAWRYKGDKKGNLLKKDDRAWARKHSKSTKDVAYQLKGSHCDLTITKVKGNWAKVKDGKGGVRDGSWIHKKHLVGFDTGGYTGDWGNTDGKLALLHQKEIVLNKADTSNMLEIVKVVRGLVEGGGFINTLKDSIAQSIAQLSASAVSSSFGGITNNSTDNSTSSNQNITLYADFPNANDVSEIKEALLSLPNLAAQYISQK